MTDNVDVVQPTPSHKADCKTVTSASDKSYITSVPNNYSSSHSGNATASCRTEHNGAQGGKARSVKAIVAWLESSAYRNTAPESQLSESSFGSKSSLNSSSTLSTIAPQLPKMNFHSTPDVEEYSLSLLKYRQYFTEKPLGRCLDDDACNTGQQSGVVIVHEGSKGKSEYAENKGGGIYPITYTPGIPKTPSNMSMISGKTSISSVSTAHNCSPAKIIIADDGSSFDGRSRAEVADFWAGIRAALWISDDELDQRAAHQQIDDENKVPRRHPHLSHLPKPVVSSMLVNSTPEKAFQG